MTQAASTSLEAQGPLASQSQRLLAIGGILLVASGMLFGDIFAMFILHPNNARIGAAMYAAAQLIPAGDAEGTAAAPAGGTQEAPPDDRSGRPPQGAADLDS